MHLRNAFLIISLWVAATLQAEVRVNARFEPPRVAAGNSARYIVEIVESDSQTQPSPEPITSLPIPNNIGGLTLRNGHTSSNQAVRSINGVTEYTSTQQLIIDAVASTPGSFTIPAYQFNYRGERLPVPEATLTVVERSADAAPTVNELIFLQADTPEQLYVGQTTIIHLQLYVASGVQLRGMTPFERNANGFTVSNQPEDYLERVEMANGRRYQVYSWPLTITPITAGPQNLDFQITVSAQMPDQRSNRRAPFGGSVFDDFFGRAERFQINTPPTQINVRPLPAEGKPKHFSGAIGQFSMEVTSDSQATRVDEPIMLSLKLSGSGNFDRIKGPELPKARGWRNYKPESTFEPSSSPLKGVKRFDYVFIPEKAGSLKLPEVAFSFFDPKVEKYIELSSPALTVEVAPSDRPAIAAAPTSESDATDTAPAIRLTKTLSPEEHLTTLDYRPKPGRRMTTDLFSAPLFYGLNGAACLALITAAIVIDRRKRLHQNADYALAQEAKQALKSAVKESQSNDASTFYRSAQCAIRLAATARMQRNLRAANFTELETQFKQSKVAEDIIEQARALFNEADNHRFSGRTHSADLQRARTQLNTILKAL